MLRTPVSTLDAFSAGNFFKAYYRRTPTVIPNRISHWQATRLWSPLHLANRFGDALVTIARYDPGGNESFLDQTLADIHITIPLRDFVTTLLSVDNRYALREDTDLLVRFPELVMNLDHFSPFSSRRRNTKEFYNSLWMGPAQYITGLHTDPGDTILFQIYGRKHVLLFDPDQTPYLCEENRTELLGKFVETPLQSRLRPEAYRILRDEVRWSRVQPFSSTAGQDSQFENAQGFEARISPGDALYIPDRWWHAVRSVDTTISVSIEPSFDGPLFRLC